jgi:hypothetical protein
MALPWLRILDTALSLATMARTANRRALAAPLERGGQMTIGRRRAPIEARLAGVVVSALKEAFDRDNQRLQFEREQREVERRRAERLLQIELARQAGDRELGRLRLLAGIASACFLATLVLAAALGGGSVASRAALGGGWLLLLASIAASFAGQSRIVASLRQIDARVGEPEPPSAGGAAQASPWLIVMGLAAIAVAVLLR